MMDTHNAQKVNRSESHESETIFQISIQIASFISQQRTFEILMLQMRLVTPINCVYFWLQCLNCNVRCKKTRFKFFCIDFQFFT